MAAPIRSGLTPRRARRIGLELGGFLLVAGLVLARRGSLASGTAVVALGALLLSLAMARPAALMPFARWWMALGSAISRVTSPILLTVIYLVLFTPMAWLRRTFGRSPIFRDPGASTYWRRREPPTTDARRAMERPF